MMNAKIHSANIRLIFIVLCVLFMGNLFAQKTSSRSLSSKISDCDGAVNLPMSGDFAIAFPSEPGIYSDVNRYQNKLSFLETNTLWLKFTPRYAGELDLKFSIDNEEVEIAVFKDNMNVGCDNIMLGKADLLFTKILKNDKLVLSFEEFDYLRLTDSSTLFIYINSQRKGEKRMNISVNYHPLDFNNALSALQNIVDQRKEVNAPTYQLAIRDQSTKLPVQARIIIEESKGFDALYSGTDLLLSLTKTLRFSVKLDAVGYFPKDTSLRVMEFSNDVTHEVFMNPVTLGKQVELEGIEFLPQSAVLTPDARDRLVRLRDFLVLNAMVEIEVQGHVHQKGRNSFGAKWLSRRRARTVANYLKKSGIDKNRITFKGYGNEFMLFPEAENQQEERANRRVEIKIL